uniref:Uncharacterized protein n=1 Tax=Candidatus Methanogaster sp. ANME-2c ERB4 TaxID=2759911 RepID=A0A7G9YIS4_9EURY|nr:hypothetical protein LLFONJKP_00029 [Methanosarcinales archaeon ANME-2c ERB4]
MPDWYTAHLAGVAVCIHSSGICTTEQGQYAVFRRLCPCRPLFLNPSALFLHLLKSFLDLFQLLRQNRCLRLKHREFLLFSPCWWRISWWWCITWHRCRCRRCILRSWHSPPPSWQPRKPSTSAQIVWAVDTFPVPSIHRYHL